MIDQDTLADALATTGVPSDIINTVSDNIQAATALEDATQRLQDARAELVSMQSVIDKHEAELDRLTAQLSEATKMLLTTREQNKAFTSMMNQQVDYLMQYLRPHIEVMITNHVSEAINIQDLAYEVSREIDVSDAVSDALEDKLSEREFKSYVKDVVYGLSFHVEVE